MQDHYVHDWKGNYDWMPLPGAQVPGLENPAACLRELRSEATTSLQAGKRIAVIAGTVTPPRPGSGIVLFESQGVALQDVVIATLAHQRSESRYDLTA